MRVRRRRRTGGPTPPVRPARRRTAPPASPARWSATRWCGRRLAAGDLRMDQAGVIVAAVDALPADVEAWVPGAATRFLLDQAAEHDAKALRILGRRLLEVIDPAAADAEEARRLAKEEEHARAVASFTMSDDGEGTCHGRFTLPSLHGQMLRKDLLARAATARRHSDDGAGGQGARVPEGRFSRHQLGVAFMDYIESRPAESAPSAGGVAATVVVTMELQTLLGGLKAASLDTGWSDQCGAGTEVGMQGRDHPRRPRRRLGGPRRRPQTSLPLRDPTDRDGRTRPGLHRVRV